MTASRPSGNFFLLRLVSRLGTRLGHVPSMVMLAALIEAEGPAGRQQAMSLYRQAAERGNAQAMCQLGIASLSSTPGESNDEQAIHWLQQAADAGHPMANWALAKMYLAGKIVEKNVAHGLDMMRRSANLGYRAACLSLADIYRQGRYGVAKDDERAVHWFTRSRSGWDRLRIRLGLARVDPGS